MFSLMLSLNISVACSYFREFNRAFEIVISPSPSFQTIYIFSHGVFYILSLFHIHLEPPIAIPPARTTTTATFTKNLVHIYIHPIHSILYLSLVLVLLIFFFFTCGIFCVKTFSNTEMKSCYLGNGKGGREREVLRDRVVLAAAAGCEGMDGVGGWVDE